MPFRIGGGDDYVSNNGSTDVIYSSSTAGDAAQKNTKWNIKACDTLGKFTIESVQCPGRYIVAESGANPKLGAKDTSGTQFEFVFKDLFVILIKTGDKYFSVPSGQHIVQSKAYDKDNSTQTWGLTKVD